MAQSDPPLLIWASETFDRKLRPNGYNLQIAQRSQWRTCRKLPSLFRMVPSLTPYDFPFPQNGAPYAIRYANGHISATGDPIHFMFGSTVRFSGSTEWLHQIQVGGRPPSWIISNGRICATAHSIRLYSAHRAVIFAIAQLSCYSLLLLTTLLSNFARGSTVLLRVKTNIWSRIGEDVAERCGRQHSCRTLSSAWIQSCSTTCHVPPKVQY